jgi:sodium/proline symporter
VDILLLSSFLIYLVVLLAIGYGSVWRSRHDQSDSLATFMLGGRSLNYWVTAISAHAADMSDWLLMGFPAAIYLKGMSGLWIAIGLTIGMSCTWHFIAAPLRTITEYYDAYTLTSYFEKRFKDTSGMLRISGALMIAFFFTVYLAAGIKGVGLLLNSVFDIPYHAGAFLGIVVVIAYTIIGGFVAAGWTELFQGIFLLCMLMITPICAYLKIGGVDAITTAAAQKNISLALIPDYSVSTILGVILGPLAWGLGYFGMPHVLIKFCGAKNTEELRKSKYIGMTWQTLALASAAAVGLVGIAYFSTLAKPELIFVEMTRSLFPSFIAGFILCAFLAATLSTMDAQLLVLAGIIAQDLYKGSINRKASDKMILFVYRLSLVVVALVSYFIAYNERSTVFGLVQYAWGGLGASFGPLVIGSLYSKSINKYGALAAIIGGGVASALWKNSIGSIAGIAINEIVPGFFVGFTLLYLVSFITRRLDTL